MFAIILSVVLSILSLGAIQAPTQAPVQAVTAPIQAPITAPTQPLAYAAPTVATEAAIKAPAKAPAKAPIAAPAPVVPATIAAPVAAPVEAPICHEDMPCWDCATMGNLICGNPTCADAGMITAEDYSCVPPSFYSTTAAADAWASYDAAGQAPTAATETIVEHVATTTDPSVTLDSTQTLVPSISEPQTFHIFSTTAASE